MSSAPEKGGSLHTRGAISLGIIKRRLEMKLGRPMNQDELFKETHIVKKKKETDQERWVEGRASTVHGRFTTDVEEFIRSQPPNESDEPIQPSDEDAERMSMEAASGPKWGKLLELFRFPGLVNHRQRLDLKGERSFRLPRARSSRPPHDRSSHPRQVYPSVYYLVDESSSDGDGNDVVQNTP
uniref:Uncharacterized protein LOC104244141 n=1 Tax=Nicotiana sylvestris TaxID=4096 RepID=A0A1U7Y0P5_NICSY|nr:PREDICTED: uncharacterized protein LOC104244141 [Nicotiana sylvestris]